MTSQVVDDLNIVFADMDTRIKEQVIYNTDGSYTILLNARHSHDSLKKAFDHALDHIRNNDWEKSDVQLIESRAHHIILLEDKVANPPLSDDARMRKWDERRKQHHEMFEREHRKIIRQLKKHKREAAMMGTLLWNEKQLELYEENKADPDFK